MSVSGNWQLHILGDFRLQHDGQPVVLSRHKMKLVLAYLALKPQEHRREKVSGLFWGDSTDEEARHSLRTTLSMLRQALGGDAILASREWVRLNPDFPLWLDAAAFERRASHFLAEPDDDLSAAAVDLYRGDLLVEFYEDWILPERERLRSLSITLLLQLAQQMRSQSDYSRAIQFAQRILAIEPAHERAHQHMIFCFMAMGDRSAALRQYEECRRALQEDVAAEPMPETTALYQWIKGRPAHVPREALVTNLPIPLTSFVGRVREVAEVRRLLERTRLVTITGPGGSGKTRLAIQTATDLVDAYRDGVWFCDLATIEDSRLVPQAVARTLGRETEHGQSPADALVAFLRARQILLILDNCEHVAATCAELVTTLLRASSRLVILATSRVALGVMGELAWPIPSLPLPADMSTPSLASLAQFEGTRLFIERAALSAPSLALSDRDAQAVVMVCRQLDGLPLAIELAAARLKVLSAGQIASQLHDRFRLLAVAHGTGPHRQQSLRAAIDWSYDLLDAEEQMLLRALSAFVGGCSLAGAAAAYDSDGGVLDVLSRLVDKSMLVVDQSDLQPRYRLLETIRLYAYERLVQAGEREVVTQRIVNFLCSMAERVEDAFLRGEEEPGVQDLSAEFANFQTAVGWCREASDGAQGLRLVAPLHIAQGSLREVGAWVEDMLAISQDAPVLLRSRALITAGSIARILNDHERGMAFTLEGLALSKTTGDKPSIARGVTGVGRSALWMGQLELAEPALEEGLARFRELGYNGGILYALDGLAKLRGQKGDLDGAAKATEAMLSLARQIHHGLFLTLGLSEAAHIAHMTGDDRRATACIQEALTVSLTTGWSREMTYLFAILADVAAQHGQEERSAILWGAASALSDSAQRPPVQADGSSFFPRLSEASAKLGQKRFDELVARGRAMSLAHAVAYGTASPDAKGSL